MTHDLFACLVGAHLIGDFLLQNEWMQAKSKHSGVCTVHVIVYAMPFSLLCGMHLLHPAVLLLIMAQHWGQDRYQVHVKWMRFFKQSPPEKWPLGPLFVDQAMHIGFLWLVTLLLY